jgi:hypothetical protein
LVKKNNRIKKKDEFIAFWRIIYNLFTGLENEAEMYQSSAKVSTLLLKLGEVSRKLKSSDNKDRSTSNIEVAEEKIPESDMVYIKESDLELEETNETSKMSSQANDSKQWFISFEQLIASLLNDDFLVNYFDAKYDINKKLSEYKANHG